MGSIPLKRVPGYDNAASPDASARLKVGLRLVITVVILGLLLSTLPGDTLMKGFRRLPFEIWFAAAVGLSVLHLAQALKWRMLLLGSGVHSPILETARAHFSGLLGNLFLPSLVGGDVLRAGIIIRRQEKAGAVAVSSLADRLLDVTALTLVAVLGVILAPKGDGGTAVKLISIAGVGCFAAWLGALALAYSRFSLPPQLGWLEGTLKKVRGAIVNLLSRPAFALAAVLVSVVVQGGFVAVNVALGSAMGIDLPLAIWMWAWSLAKLVALLPISLGGIGVREVALAAFLAPFGVEAGLAVAQSLVWESVMIAVAALAGGLSLIMRLRSRREAGASS